MSENTQKTQINHNGLIISYDFPVFSYVRWGGRRCCLQGRSDPSKLPKGNRADFRVAARQEVATKATMPLPEA